MSPPEAQSSSLHHCPITCSGVEGGEEMRVVYNHPENFLKQAELEQHCMYQGNTHIEVKCVNFLRGRISKEE